MKNALRAVILTSFTACAFIALGSTPVYSACGDIITEYEFDGVVEVDRTPIEDCNNPFNADSPDPFSFQLMLDNQDVVSGTELILVEGQAVAGNVVIDVNASGGFLMQSFSLFLKEGMDYRQVASENNSQFTLSSLQPGEYVATLTSSEMFLSAAKTSFWQKIFNAILRPQTTYAYYPDYEDVVTIPFSVIYQTPPAGASSVLFLPGIQASRLYTEGALGTENQLWEPNRNTDVEKLAMTKDGVSINEIYTRDVLDEINVLPVIQGNIYKSFLSEMNNLATEEEIIKEFVPFAYDWRYSVFDVATKEVEYTGGEKKRLLDEVVELAATSYTGKVTIISHSNGGLVAKALLSEYGETELAGLVDKVVFIGTPQLGTPKAIGSMLHGLDQSLGYGLVAQAGTIREVTKNIPGAYTLLPSNKYFSEVGEPLITTDGSELAEPVSEYGDITSAEKLQTFLLNSLTNRQDAVGLNEPLILNTQLAQEALLLQNMLDSWQAPEGVRVYEVVGTGLATIKAYEYREYGCTEVNQFCILDSYLKPFPIMTNDGDETVVAASAEGYGGDKVTARVNIREQSVGVSNPNITHKNLTESDSVQAFVDSVVRYPYVSDSILVPEFTEVTSKYTLIGVHSPVSLLAVDDDGNEVGMTDNQIKEEIVGSQYFELGGSKYVVLPATVDVKIKVEGTGEGIFSLSVDEINDSGQQNEVSLLANATSGPMMSAEFTIQDGVYSSLQSDINGDGVFEFEQTLSGELIESPSVTYDYTDLKEIIKNLGLNRWQEKFLMTKVRITERFSKKSNKKETFRRLEARSLAFISTSLMWYQQAGIISEETLIEIKMIIDNLE